MSDDQALIAIVSAALAKPAGPERRAFLDQVCGDDPARRAKLEVLLVAAEELEANHQTANPPAAVPSPEPSPVPSPDYALESIGMMIGRYKLLEKIGEGGFGTVYMAEQMEPVQRKVALKIIKPGMDTREVVARFEVERQAVALMDHPNIAQVYDGGVTQAGRPYFVMELVRGVPITEFCDQHNLPPVERLELFMKVCHAVQHAHQKAIIHRDLKPSNILVTLHGAEAVPKIIDFGVAKALGQKLTEKTLFTGFMRMIGTPAYMSPEQAELQALDIDTRADIYSLGVLLYELLTGVTPFDRELLAKAALDEIRRMIRETEPPKPSTRLQTLGANLTEVAQRRHTDAPKLIHLVRGDLDWIVMKALEKDRGRRYETANGLAMDIQRYLTNEPIIARPPSKLYEFQKTVRRHKIGFATTAAILLALGVGTVVSTWQAVKARRATEAALRAEQKESTARSNEAKLRVQADANERRAELEASRSTLVAQFMKDMLQGVGPAVALGRDTTLLREILDQTAARLDELKPQPEVETELRETLGLIYRDLSDFPRAREMLQETLKLQRELHSGDHPDVARLVYHLADICAMEGRQEDSVTGYQDALAMRRRLFGDKNLEVAASLYGLGEALRRRGATHREAEASYRQALAIRRELAGSRSTVTAQNLTGLAVLLRNYPDRLGEAEACLREALEIRSQLDGPEHPDIAYTLMNLGFTLAKVPERRGEAEHALREAIAMQQKSLGDHRTTAMAIQFLATLVTNQNETIALQREALAMRRKVLGNHPDTKASVRSLITALVRVGDKKGAVAVLRDDIKQLPAAPEEFYPALMLLLEDLTPLCASTEAIALMDELMRPLDPSARPHVHLLMRRAEIWAQLTRWNEAMIDLRRAIQLAPDEHYPYLQLAILLLVTKDQESYEILRTEMLERFADTEAKLVVERIAKACLLLPGDATTLGRVTELTARGATLTSDLWWVGTWLELSTGLAHYRAGRYAPATECMQRVARETGERRYARDFLAHLVLAMIHHQQDHKELFQQEWNAAMKIRAERIPRVEGGDLSHEWVNVLIAEIFLAEALSLTRE